MLTHYLSRLDNINKEKGFVVLDDNNKGKFVDKNKILKNFIEAIPNFKNQGLPRVEELTSERENLLRNLIGMREKKTDLETKVLIFFI